MLRSWIVSSKFDVFLLLGFNAGHDVFPLGSLMMHSNPDLLSRNQKSKIVFLQCILLFLACSQAWAQGSENITVVADIKMGEKWLCVPSYTLYFRGRNTKATLATTKDDCESQFAYFDKTELLDDLRKLREWMTINEEAKVRFLKNYHGPASGVSWVFASFDDGYSWAFLNQSRDSQPISPNDMGRLIDLVERDFDKKRREHISEKDPFK